MNLIHHNTINVQGQINNQEYGGAELGGAYGIQVEGAKDAEIYENTVTAVARKAEAYAFRINNGATNVYVHNNLFKAVRVGNNIEAASLKLWNLVASTMRFENNTIESNNQWIGESSDVDGAVLTSNLFKATGDLVGFEPIEVFPWENGVPPVNNLRFVNNSYADDVSKQLFKESRIIRTINVLGIDPLSSFLHSFTVNILVATSSGALISNASVSIVDVFGNQVYSGNSDINGRLVVVLDEFRTAGQTQTKYSPYIVSVSYGNQTTTYLITVTELTSLILSLDGSITTTQTPTTHTTISCTSFTYSSWGTCQSNNTKARTIITQSPSNCTGGTPILSESCTYVPTITTPTITGSTNTTGTGSTTPNPTITPTVPNTQGTSSNSSGQAMTALDKQALVAKLKAQLIELIRQLIQLLQQELIVMIQQQSTR